MQTKTPETNVKNNQTILNNISNMILLEEANVKNLEDIIRAKKNKVIRYKKIIKKIVFPVVNEIMNSQQMKVTGFLDKTKLN